MSQPIQVDPAGCGCTECLIGLYVPLDQATEQQIAALLHGDLRDATGERFTVSVVTTDYLGGRGGKTITVTAEHYPGRSWTWEGYPALPLSE